MAIRPSSLLLSTAPVFLGTAFAFADGIGYWPAAVAALIAAWLLHIIVNLTNDYNDLQKGADKKGDYDPMRGILVGEIPLSEMKIAIILAVTFFIVPAAYLILRAGSSIAVIALAAMLAAIFYTAGKRPLGYRGFGDLLVFVFFGPVAVAGTYYVQSLEINPAIILSGCAPGFFSVGVLTINNIRDHEKDKAVHKNTLVVRFGKEFGRTMYNALVFLACILPVGVYLITRQHELILLSAAVYFLLLPAVAIVTRESNADAMNRAIGLTVQACLIYSLVFGIGWFF